MFCCLFQPLSRGSRTPTNDIARVLGSGDFFPRLFFTVRLFRRAMYCGEIWWRKPCHRKFRRMESLTAGLSRLAVVSPWEVSPKAVPPFEVQPWKFSPHEFFFCPRFSPQAVLPWGTFINFAAGSYTFKSLTAIIFSSRDSFAAGNFTLKSLTAMIFCRAIVSSKAVSPSP